MTASGVFKVAEFDFVEKIELGQLLVPLSPIFSKNFGFTGNRMVVRARRLVAKITLAYHIKPAQIRQNQYSESLRTYSDNPEPAQIM